MGSMRRLSAALLSVVALSASTVSLAVTPANAAAPHTVYRVATPLCPPARPGHVTCMALREVTASRDTPGAVAMTAGTAPMSGPRIAAAYHLNADGGSGQTVGIVLWSSNPNLRSDLNHFDRVNHIPTETSRSLRIVNQSGASRPLPAPAKDSGTELTLDVQAVRSVCHRCRVLVVLAASGTDRNLAAAENTAVRLGARVVSNSWGGPEITHENATLTRAFNHPGVVVTAASADDGWNFWDIAEQGYSPPNRASFPATLPGVVSVGGTTLRVDSAGHWASETAWSGSGSGCSHDYAATAAQRAAAGYAAASARCKGKRAGVDVAVDGNPATGMRVYDSYKYSGSKRWMTVGGTSLSAPLIAGMWALAGGPAGVSRPSDVLYQNLRYRASALHDVSVGGTGYCGGRSISACEQMSGNQLGTDNPNEAGFGWLDCSFPAVGSVSTSAHPRTECNAGPGYDGVSGVGTPAGVWAFRSTVPKASFRVTAGARPGHAVAVRGYGVPQISGARIDRVGWSWGDGSTTSGTSLSATHTFRRAGTYRVHIAVRDTTGQWGSRTWPVTVGRPLHVVIGAHASVHRHTAAGYRSSGTTDPNSGVRIVSYAWTFSDHHTATGRSVHHTWSRAGTYTVRLRVTDSAGNHTTVTKKVRVS